MRRIKWGSFEHQQREIYAEHVHVNGGYTFFGDGRLVMCVCKGRKPFVEVIGEDGRNVLGEEFVYSNFFLPEEMAGD